MPPLVINAGDRFGLWTVIVATRAPNGLVRTRPGFICRCDCGDEKVVPADTLRRGTSRGCFSCRVNRSGKCVPFADRIGQRFGRLLLLEAVIPSRARCLCDCGNEKTVFRGNLISGATTSCGCAALLDASHVTHGLSGTPMYQLFAGMIRRCHGAGDATNDIGLRRYRDRGITVCAGWRASVEVFIADMGPRPSPKHSIERMHNDRGYWCGKCDECVASKREPNCCWATPKEQARNTSRNVWIEHDGRRMLAIDWARELGISRQRFDQRMREGLPPERLFALGNANIIRALRGKAPGSRKFTHNGKCLTVAEWSRETGVSATSIAQRLRAGRTIVEALQVEPLKSRRGAPADRKARAHVAYHCRACGEAGHNKATCANQIRKAS